MTSNEPAECAIHYVRFDIAAMCRARCTENRCRGRSLSRIAPQTSKSMLQAGRRTFVRVGRVRWETTRVSSFVPATSGREGYETQERVNGPGWVQPSLDASGGENPEHRWHGAPAADKLS